MAASSPNSLSLNEEKAEEQNTDAMVGERPIYNGTPVSRRGAVGGPQQAATTRAIAEESTAVGFGCGGSVTNSTPEGSSFSGGGGKTFGVPPIDTNLGSSKNMGGLAPPVMMAPPIPMHRQPTSPLTSIPSKAAEPTIISGTSPGLTASAAAITGSVHMDKVPSSNILSTMGSNRQVGGDVHAEEGKAMFNSAPHQIENLEVAEQEILTNIQELQRKLMELKTDEHQVHVF